MRLYILFSLLVVLLSLSNVIAQSSVIGQSTGINSISGTVFSEGGRPVDQTYVELLTDFSNSLVRRTKTTVSGHYTFAGIPYGRYLVRVKAFGTDFEEQEKSLELYNVSADPRRNLPMYERVDFYLTRRKSADRTPQITGVVFAQEVPKEASDIFRSTDQNDASIDNVDKLKKAIAIFPKYYDALIRLGNIYNRNKQFNEAKDVFLTVVEVNPQGYIGWYGLGYAQFQLNDAASLASIQKAIDIDKTVVDSWFVLGLAQRKAQNYKAALEALLQARKLDNGRNIDINWNLALLYYHNLKMPAEAADELETYLKIDPDTKNKTLVKALIVKFRSKNPYGKD